MREYHGESKSKEYQVWCQMLARCYNPRHRKFHRYGARGIRVCERWRTSFSAFLEDMGRCPFPGWSIEREDNDGPYCPENCCWSDATEQARNTSRNRLLTFDGRTQCLAAWAVERGMRDTTLLTRIDVLGWTVEEALTRPVRAVRRFRMPRQLRQDEEEARISAFGRNCTPAGWEDLTGIDADTIKSRLQRGWTPEEAVSTPPGGERYRPLPNVLLPLSDLTRRAVRGVAERLERLAKEKSGCHS